MNIHIFKSKNIQYEISNSRNKKSRTSSPAENQDKKTAKFESFPAAEKPRTRPTPPSTHPFCTHCYRTHTHKTQTAFFHSHTPSAHADYTFTRRVYRRGRSGWMVRFLSSRPQKWVVFDLHHFQNPHHGVFAKAH